MVKALTHIFLFSWIPQGHQVHSFSSVDEHFVNWYTIYLCPYEQIIEMIHHSRTWFLKHDFLLFDYTDIHYIVAQRFFISSFTWYVVLLILWNFWPSVKLSSQYWYNSIIDDEIFTINLHPSYHFLVKVHNQVLLPLNLQMLEYTQAYEYIQHFALPPALCFPKELPS